MKVGESGIESWGVIEESCYSIMKDIVCIVYMSELFTREDVIDSEW